MAGASWLVARMPPMALPRIHVTSYASTTRLGQGSRLVHVAPGPSAQRREPGGVVSATENLIGELESRGWKAAVVPYARRAEAIQEIVSRHERGELDESFYQEYLAPIVTEPVPESPTPRSLILIAVPDRPLEILFTLDGATFPVTVAPGYVQRPTPKAVEVVQEILAPLGFSVARVDGPQKAMATLSGFARYGRNNISYISGFGSFHALRTLVSDLPCDDEPPHGLEMLPRCKTCQACRVACPTGAIAEDRFLLHAERCVTYWNEKSPEVPFPEWIEPAWHNALFGCLTCQRICPENHAFLDPVIEGPSFDERTTRALLAGAKKEDFENDVRSVLEEWRLADLLGYLPRNLGALVTESRDSRTKDQQEKESGK